MASKDIKISISTALNAAGIHATKSQINSMAKSMRQSMSEAAQSTRKHWADIKAAWDMGSAAIRKALGFIGNAVKSAFRFETQTVQFKTLIGSIDEAKRHMADLKQLGDTPPFSLEEFAKASRQMMVMTDGVLGFKDSLKMVGDAAAATGNPIETVGNAFSRLYGYIRDGQPLGRAVMELRNMGILTPEVAQRLQDMQAAGKSTSEIWGEVEKSFSRYNGAMNDTKKTGEGLIASMKTRWENAVRIFGQAFEDSEKDGVRKMTDALAELEESGLIEEWADGAAKALNKVVEGFKSIGSTIGSVMNHLQAGRDFWNKEDERQAEAEQERGELVSTEKINAWKTKRTYRAEDGSITEEYEVDERLKRRIEREEKRKTESAKRERVERERIQEALAEGQRKIDAKNADALYKERMKAGRKAAVELAQEEAAAFSKMFSNLSMDAENRLGEAKGRLDRAWGWYRNKDSLAKQLQEEKDEAAAERQFEKDFKQLRRRRNWRTANDLSLNDEAVRRVAFAREETQAAAEWARATAEASRRSADSLDELKQIFKEA